MKKTIITVISMAASVIVGFVIFVAFIIITGNIAQSEGMILDPWLYRHPILTLTAITLSFIGLPTLMLLLGIYGVLPGTRKRPSEPAADTKQLPKGRGDNWRGIFSILWMLSIFAIIHYIVEPAHLTYALSWALLCVLVCGQLVFGFILAHTGLRCRNRAGRACAVTAMAMFIWFICLGLVPLILDIR